MRLRLLTALSAAVAVQAAVEIVPPSPYMSSPPPGQMDTSVIDPGRRPKCVVVEPGTQEVWYGGWNLAKDVPTTEALAIKDPRKGSPSVRAAFNDRGWPTEIVYYDAKRRIRWTKLLRFPKDIPSGPGDVPYTATWISAEGKSINLAAVSAAYHKGSWKVGAKRGDVEDALGLPLLVEATQGTIAGNPETWTYLIDGQEVRFSFDIDKHLTAEPSVAGAQPVAPVPPVVAKPTATPQKKDSAVKPAAAPKDTAKPKTGK